jgi:hypothetical protein
MGLGSGEAVAPLLGLPELCGKCAVSGRHFTPSRGRSPPCVVRVRPPDPIPPTHSDTQVGPTVLHAS